MVSLLGWAAWLFIVFLALSFAYGCRISTARGEGFTWAGGVQTMFWWIIAAYFLLSPTSKFHIIWVAPAAFFSAQVIVFVGIPIVSPAVLAMTRVFLAVVLLGVKRR